MLTARHAYGLVAAMHVAVLAPKAAGGEQGPLVSPHPVSYQAQATDVPSPAVWGIVGLVGYPTGEHEAPNGLVFDPLIGLTADLNIGLLPKKQLYIFWNSDLWAQGGAVGAPVKSLREFDGELGIAWDYFDSLELRASAYSLNNLNRGFSLSSPDGYRDGWKIENRYYLGSGDIYDIGTLPFIGIGYYPSESLEGNNGRDFHPGLFGRGYLTEDLPTPFRSYLYGGVQLVAQDVATPRLLDADVGLAVRPFSDHQGFELRFGYDRTDDVQAHVTSARP